MLSFPLQKLVGLKLTIVLELIYKRKFTNKSNLIHGCHVNNINNIIFLGSSCVYPKNCKIPIKEEYLLSGKLEETNEPYAIAKIAGIKMWKVTTDSTKKITFFNANQYIGLAIIIIRKFAFYSCNFKKDI